MEQPRGIRNHNPGNIEYNGTPWQGLAEPKSDGRFCRFEGPTWGIRAIARTLITYQDKHGLENVYQMISRWAPPVENNVQAYSAHAEKALGVGPSTPINVHRYAVMRPLVETIITHENGVMPYSDAQLDKGLLLAGIEAPQKPLTQSRTVRGGQVAGTAGTVAAVAGAVAQVQPALPVVEWMRDNLGVALIILGAAAVAGVGYMIWARLDDRNKGLR